jgi:hypothetical protein
MEDSTMTTTGTETPRKPRTPRLCLVCGYPFWTGKVEHDYHISLGVAK